MREGCWRRIRLCCDFEIIIFYPLLYQLLKKGIKGDWILMLGMTDKTSRRAEFLLEVQNDSAGLRESTAEGKE